MRDMTTTDPTNPGTDRQALAHSTPAPWIPGLQVDLTRDPFGRLALRSADGSMHEGVIPVRAFPIQAPDEGVALVTQDGKELLWIDHLADLPDPVQQLVRQELNARDFMPVIARIEQVSSYATPSTWRVMTDRGETEFVLRGEEDLRRIGDASLLVGDSHGIQFLIQDMAALDRHSRRILDRFL